MRGTGAANEKADSESFVKDWRASAVAFGSALIEGQFLEAHEMLSAEGKSVWSEARLREAFSQLTSYFVSKPDRSLLAASLIDWPNRKSGDLGFAHVAIIGDGEVEGISIVICGDRDTCFVRSIEWGRP